MRCKPPSLLSILKYSLPHWQRCGVQAGAPAQSCHAAECMLQRLSLTLLAPLVYCRVLNMADRYAQVPKCLLGICYSFQTH